MENWLNNASHNILDNFLAPKRQQKPYDLRLCGYFAAIKEYKNDKSGVSEKSFFCLNKQGVVFFYLG